MRAFFLTVVVLLVLSNCHRAHADEPVQFVTDKAAVATCEFKGSIHNAAGYLQGFTLFGAAKLNSNSQAKMAVDLGADTVLRRGSLDVDGVAFKCQK